MNRERLKHLFLVCWLSSVAMTAIVLIFAGINIKQLPFILQSLLADLGLARSAALYVAIYALRPFTILPSTILSLAAGYLFGPWLGIVFTLVGQTLSGNVAFMIARFLGRDFVRVKESSTMKKWDERIRQNALISVLLMRLLFLPFDVVNYACGVTSMRMRDFTIATLIGSVPGAVTFVLLGGSVSPKVSGMLMVFGMEVPQKTAIFSLSIISLAFGLVVSFVVRRLNQTESS